MTQASPTSMEADTTDRADRPGRPVEVWVVVGLGLVQGLLALAAAALLLYARSDPDLVELIAENDPDFSDGALLAAGLLVGVIGLVNTVFAVLLARGSRLVRGVYAAVATFEIATATYGLVAVRDLRGAAVVSLLYPVAIVWLLYGSQRSQRFFDT